MLCYYLFIKLLMRFVASADDQVIAKYSTKEHLKCHPGVNLNNIL